MADNTAKKKRKRRGKISSKLRFEILDRDKFTCQYCGRKAPDVKLHVDHIFPVTLGGREEKSNLITACEECNCAKNGNYFSNTINRFAKILESTHGDKILPNKVCSIGRLRYFYLEEERIRSIQSIIMRRRESITMAYIELEEVIRILRFAKNTKQRIFVHCVITTLQQIITNSYEVIERERKDIGYRC